MAENAECDHLPVAQRLPVGPTARAVRTQKHCPRLVPALGCGGIFERIWAVLVAECDELGGVQWEWQPADAMLGKARFRGGKKRARIPSEPRKKGHQKHVVADGDGGPLGVVIAPGRTCWNRRLLAATIESIVVERPEPTKDEPQHMPLDKAYDNPTGEEAATAAGYTPHIRRIGEEKKGCDRSQGHKPRRWVVERTFAWLSKCRGILVRYKKKDINYLGADSAGLRTVLVSQAPPHGSM